MLLKLRLTTNITELWHLLPMLYKYLRDQNMNNEKQFGKTLGFGLVSSCHPDFDIL